MNTQTTPRSSNVVRMNKVSNDCSSCRLSHLCVAGALRSHDLDKLIRLVKHPQPLKRGEYLNHSRDKFRSIFVVRVGSLKSSIVDEDGAEQVNAFHLPGEIMGFDAISSGQYPGSTQALETSSVCEIPFRDLERLCATTSGLHRRLMHAMSQEILGDEKHMLLLSKKSAEARLVAWLMDLSTRFQTRGYSPNEFRLTMSRVDIGNYLGLAMETVSRLFSHLRDQGLIEVDKRNVRLVNKAGMKALIDGSIDVPLKRTGT